MSNFTYKEIKAFVEAETLILPITMKLSKPISFGESTILDCITFEREPVAGDIELLPVGGQVMGDSYKVISKITGWELPKIKRLSVKDLKRISSVLQYFLDDSEEDGEQD